MAGTTLPTPLYPLYMRAYNIGAPEVTVIFAVYAVAVVVGLLCFGHQSDRIGRRKTLLTGLMLSLVSALCFLFARSLVPIYAGRVLSGLSAGIFTGAGTAAMVDYSTENRRREITLLAVVVNVGGLGAGTLLSGLVAQYAPLPLVLPYAIDGLLVITLLAAMFEVRETVKGARGHLVFSMQRMRVPRGIRGVFARAAVAGICAFAVSGVFSAVAPPFLWQELHEHSPAVAGALVFLLMGSSAAGQLLVDRLPRRAAFAIGCAILAIGLALLAVTIVLHSLTAIFASSFASGVGQGLVMGFGLANINERITERRGEVTSAYFVLLYGGLAFPVVAVGFASAALGVSRAGLVFCAIVGTIVCIVGVLQVFANENRSANAGRLS